MHGARTWLAGLGAVVLVTGTALAAGRQPPANQLVTDTGGLALRDDGIRFPDGSFMTRAAASSEQVLLVAKSGGDYESIQAALDSITDASASKPYLVRVAPGVYEERVVMKGSVHIEGSGEGITKITFAGSDVQDPFTFLPEATVQGRGGELRFLTVENTGGAKYAVAIRDATELLHVTASAADGVLMTAAVYGVFRADHLTVTASSPTGASYGLYSRGSEVSNLRAQASGAPPSAGVRHEACRQCGTLYVRHAKVSSLHASGFLSHLHAAFTEVDFGGGPANCPSPGDLATGFCTCVAVYVGGEPLDANCLPASP